MIKETSLLSLTSVGSVMSTGGQHEVFVDDKITNTRLASAIGFLVGTSRQYITHLSHL